MSNEIRDKAYKDYCDGMKYRDIAEKYGVSLSAVKSWATRYWKSQPRIKKLQPQPKKVATGNSDKKLKERLLESVSENDELTEKRRLFCLYYAMSHNATQSYLKAYGGGKVVAAVEGNRILRIPKVAAEVKRLREILRNEIDIGLPDLLQYCLKVIGAAENNLRHIDVEFPLGTFTVVTGVSGSGKSSLVNEILFKKLGVELTSEPVYEHKKLYH